MIKFLARNLPKLCRSQSGVAATEFALVAPLLLILIMGAVDVSSAVSDSFNLKTAARVGAEFALTNSDDSAGIQAAVLAATNISTDSLAISSTVFCECAKVAITCGQTCPLDDSVPNQFITVLVTGTYNPLFLSNSVSQLKAEVTLPIQ